MDIKTHIDNNGRLLIPAELRKKYHLDSGSAVVIRIVDNQIQLVNLKQVIAEAQDIIKQYVPRGVSLVDELRKMREEEVSLETKESSKCDLPKGTKGK